MLNFKLSLKSFYEEKSQAYVVFCEQDVVITNPAVLELESRFYKPLKNIIEDQKFTAKVGSRLVVVAEKDERPIYLILLGLGTTNKLSKSDRVEYFRRAIGQLIRFGEASKISSFSLNLLNLNHLDISYHNLVQEVVSTAILADYNFDRFITDPEKENKDREIVLCIPKIAETECQLGLVHGNQIGHSTNKARDWCNLPGNYISPKTFAEKAELIAISHNLKIKIFGKKEIYDMGMGGLRAVSQGSNEDPRFIVMEYLSDKATQTIALVGKGITFDSGGLSLKTSSGMETMKDDMAGGAAVAATMELLGHVRPDVNVIGLIPLAENMPSGSAMRPGDIITFYNGKTAEVKNTDAEGRLILADALAYAVKNYKLDAIIDIATLTTACIYGLGHFFAGLLSKEEKLVEQIIAASHRSGDRVWQLPLHDDFKGAIKSDIADISNVGNEKYLGGTITAAFFLKNFVGDIPWAHIDISGTAFNVPDMSYYRPGATGFGVRLFIDLITHWKKLK